MVTGAAGAGKTVLVLELILALPDGRGEDDPVPVRLSLTEWDTEVPLQAWLVRHLVNVYDWPEDMAAGLVRQHRVLPVLDGLDEMDRTQPSGAPSPVAPRARTVLDTLNAYQEGRAAGPVVLTCRTAHYEALSGPTRLLDAARIDIDAVAAPAAKAYLLQRVVDPVRWQPVLEILDRYPSGALATTLSTPWRLCLAATVYARDGDPADLLNHATPHDLDEHLLARFIPAAIALRPHHRYDTSDVHHWLAHLATQLNVPAHVPRASPTTDVGPGTDVVPHQLWPLAGRRRVRAVDALLTALAVLLPLPLAWTTFAPLPIAGVKAALAVLAGCLSARSQLPTPRRIDLRRLRTPTNRRRPLIALTIGIVCALVMGCVAQYLVISVGFESKINERVYGLSAGIAVGIAVTSIGLVYGLAGEPTAATKPREIVRSDFVYGLMGGLAVGLAVGLTGAAFGFPDGPLGSLEYALALGLAPGLAAGLAFTGAGVGRRHLVFLLCSRGKLPLRLGTFLDWACAAGLMRLAGAAYQFRHRELQQWLSSHPVPTRQAASRL
ncbi:NACHT domain-containing protein [Streptomyces sp. NPDC054813]